MRSINLAFKSAASNPGVWACPISPTWLACALLSTSFPGGSAAACASWALLLAGACSFCPMATCFVLLTTALNAGSSSGEVGAFSPLPVSIAGNCSAVLTTSVNSDFTVI